jgi:hypothetical protein
MIMTSWLSLTAIPIILTVGNKIMSLGTWLNNWSKGAYCPMRSCITGSLEALETMNTNNDTEASRKEMIVGIGLNVKNSRYVSTATDAELIARFTALLAKYPKA